MQRYKHIKFSLAVLAGLLTSALAAQAQVHIPANFAAPAGSVDTSKPGFNVFVTQQASGRNNDTASAEAQIAAAKADPTTNVADLTQPGFPGDGTPIFTEEGVLNYNEHATDPAAPVTVGNFGPDKPAPGIPSATGADNYAYEITTFLDLPAGTNTFGVNSDDGFRLTIGTGLSPYDAFAKEVGVFSGGRGSSDSIFSFVVDQAGLYPARLLYYEGGGDSNLEFFSVTPDGEKVLVNDSGNPASTKSYRQASGAATPFVSTVSPLPGATGVSASPTLNFAITDTSSLLNASSIKLSLNGAVVVPTVTKVGNITTVAYNVPTVLSANTAAIVGFGFADTTGHVNTNSYSFVVGTFKTIPSDLAVPAAQVNLTDSGFTVFVTQGDPATITLNNSTADREAQIRGYLIDPDTGLPYNNIATPNTDSTFIFHKDFLNWNQDSTIDTPASIGNFPNDDTIPGIPGTGGGNDNIAAEITAFLQLPAGITSLGVNSDDGFRLTVGKVYRDPSNLELGVFDGGRGSSDTLFDVNVQQAGLYPVRLIWYEGNGGANLEFFSVAGGVKILVNDPTNALAIKAYASGTLVQPAVIDFLNPKNGTIVAGTNHVTGRISDAATTVATTGVTLTVNNVDVTSSANLNKGTNGAISFDYAPAAGFAPLSSNTVVLVITDSAGAKTTNAVGFRVPDSGIGILRNTYLDIAGTAVANLISDPKYLALTPDDTAIESQFEYIPSGLGNYGSDFLGYFIPDVTDDYTFYLSSDDNSQLFLSTDSDPANKVQIAAQNGWNSNRNWTGDEGGQPLANRISAPFHLTGGQRYFIQALMKEGGGGDSLSVAVRRPTDPALVSGAAPLQGDRLRPFKGIVPSVRPAGTTTLQQGHSITLHASAVADKGPLAYQWQKGGVDITGATSDSFSIPAAAVADAGDYTIKVSNDTTNGVSPVAHVAVQADTAAPTVIGAGTSTPGYIAVQFSEVLDPTSATSLGNYTVSGGATVTSALLTKEGKVVVLGVTGAPASGGTVSVKSVADLASNAMSSTAVSVDIHHPAIAGLVDQDVGAPALGGGAAALSDSEFVISAGGSDLWGNSDQIHFIGTQVSGDFDEAVQLVNIEPVNRWSKAGLDVRESLDGGAKSLSAYASPAPVPTVDAADIGFGNNLVEAGYRPATDGATGGWNTTGNPIPFPGPTQAANPTGLGADTSYTNVWVRLNRVGPKFRAFFSTNGVDWTTYAVKTDASFTNNAYVGLVLTAHNDSTYTNTTHFANWTRTATPPPPGGPKLTATANAGGTLTIAWDKPGKLQETTELKSTGTVWTDTPNGGTSPVTVPTATGSGKFYRVQATP